MDWSFLTGLGTIILAIATILYVTQSRLQTQALMKQVNLQIGQQIPRLFIKRVDFEPNSLKIEIQNAGNTPAYWVGLETMFFVIGQRLYSDQHGDNEISWGESVKLREEGKTIFSKYFWIGPDRPKLRFENREVDAGNAVSFLSPQGVSVYFPPNSVVQTETRPIFLISWRGDQGLRSYKGFDYNEFREFLLSNSIRAAAVVMSLVCKDTGETVHGQGYVASFVVRPDLDHSLVDSGRNSQRFDFIPLSHEEQLSGNSWIPNDHYQNTYSNWHVF